MLYVCWYISKVAHWKWFWMHLLKAGWNTCTDIRNHFEFASSFQWMVVLMVETLELRYFISSLIFFTLFHARLWLIASWPLLLPIYSLAGNLPLLTGCFQQHNTTWQIKARYIMNISWNNPTVPCLRLLWWTLASNNGIFSCLPVLQAAFTPP